MAIPLEKRKTIFNNGVPVYTKVQREFVTGLTKEFGGQPPPSTLTALDSGFNLSKAPERRVPISATGILDLRSIPQPPVPKTYQQIISISTNNLVTQLNDYPYIERRNDILQLGDARGRSEKYPPEILLHSTGGPGYAGNGFDDGFVRGGIVQSTAHAVEDVIRIGNFFASTKGILWILREQGLQMTNPRPETRIFNPLSLLIQTLGGHLGLHIPRHGLNPFSEGTGQPLDFGYNTYSTAKDYEFGTQGGKSYTVVPFVAVPRNQPKLLDLVSEMHLGQVGLSLSTISPVTLLTQLSGWGIDSYISPRDKPGGGPEISTISYQAAANAPYGGFSIFGGGMHRSVNSLLDYEGFLTNKYPRTGDGSIGQLVAQAKILINSPVSALTGLVSAGVGKALGAVGNAVGGVTSKIGLKVPGGTSLPSPSPELLKVYKSLSYGELGLNSTLYVSSDRETLEGPSENYKIYAKIAAAERKASTRNQMMINRGFSDPGSPIGTSFDKTNSQPRIDGELTDNPYDLVPLIFYDIANDQSLVFRAVLSSITDTYSPEWNEYNYIGNPQTYYTYKRTIRDFAFTFKIYTDSERELRWNWMKLNRFVGMVYPSYNAANRMVGPFMRLTVADMLNRIPGYISALSITVDDNTPWEINLFSADVLARVPHIVECAVSYRVVGDEPLDGDKTRFYAQNKMYNGVWNWDRWSK